MAPDGQMNKQTSGSNFIIPHYGSKDPVGNKNVMHAPTDAIGDYIYGLNFMNKI